MVNWLGNRAASDVTGLKIRVMKNVQERDTNSSSGKTMQSFEHVILLFDLLGFVCEDIEMASLCRSSMMSQLSFYLPSPAVHSGCK